MGASPPIPRNGHERGEGQGREVIMGASPHTPLLSYYIGIVREEGLCSRQEMCEHLLPDRLTFSGACGTGRLHIPANRVLPSQGCTFILSPLPSDGVWGGSPMFTESL